MYDVVVVGGGVAGLQAAVFTAKADLDTLVLDAGGSLATSTDRIQNLLTEERIAGEEVLERGRERVRAFGGEIERATVERVERLEDGGDDGDGGDDDSGGGDDSAGSGAADGGRFRVEATVESDGDGEREDGETVTHDTETVVVATASEFDFLEPLDVSFESGREGEFTMERHLRTDDANRAARGVYAAGLANRWEYQTAVAIGDGARTAVNLVSDRRDEAHVDHDW